MQSIRDKEGSPEDNDVTLGPKTNLQGTDEHHLALKFWCRDQNLQPAKNETHI